MNSISKNLECHLGGKWTHIPFHGLWECDDGKRYVQKCSVLGGMQGDEHVGTQVWLYGEGTPRRAEKYMVSKILFILPIFLALAGCASTPVAAPPRIVTVTKVQYVPMPAADLLPCTLATQRIATGADVVAAWQRTLEALAVCNAQVSDLRRLSVQRQPN